MWKGVVSMRLIVTNNKKVEDYFKGKEETIFSGILQNRDLNLIKAL